MLFNFVEGRSCGEDGTNPDEEEIEHKRRAAAKCTAEGFDIGIDNLRIILLVVRNRVWC